MVFIQFFVIFMVKIKLFWSSFKIKKEWSYNLWPISDFFKYLAEGIMVKNRFEQKLVFKYQCHS